MFHVQCSCGKAYQVEAQWAGQWMQCQACGQTLQVPVPQPTPLSPVALGAPGKPSGPLMANDPLMPIGSGYPSFPQATLPTPNGSNESPDNRKTLIYVAAGGFGVLVLFLVSLIAITRGSSRDTTPVAQVPVAPPQEQATTPAADQPATSPPAAVSMEAAPPEATPTPNPAEESPFAPESKTAPEFNAPAPEKSDPPASPGVDPAGANPLPPGKPAIPMPSAQPVVPGLPKKQERVVPTMPTEPFPKWTARPDGVKAAQGILRNQVSMGSTGRGPAFNFDRSLMVLDAGNGKNFRLVNTVNGKKVRDFKIETKAELHPMGLSSTGDTVFFNPTGDPNIDRNWPAFSTDSGEALKSPDFKKDNCWFRFQLITNHDMAIGCNGLEMQGYRVGAASRSFAARYPLKSLGDEFFVAPGRKLGFWWQAGTFAVYDLANGELVGKTEWLPFDKVDGVGFREDGLEMFASLSSPDTLAGELVRYDLAQGTVIERVAAPKPPHYGDLKSWYGQDRTTQLVLTDSPIAQIQFFGPNHLLFDGEFVYDIAAKRVVGQFDHENLPTTDLPSTERTFIGRVYNYRDRQQMRSVCGVDWPVAGFDSRVKKAATEGVLFPLGSRFNLRVGLVECPYPDLREKLYNAIAARIERMGHFVDRNVDAPLVYVANAKAEVLDPVYRIKPNPLFTTEPDGYAMRIHYSLAIQHNGGADIWKRTETYEPSRESFQSTLLHSGTYTDTMAHVVWERFAEDAQARFPAMLSSEGKTLLPVKMRYDGKKGALEFID